MESTLKYRTQGSLPIGSQTHAQYIPRTPEPKTSHPTKAKVQDSPAPTQGRVPEQRRPPPPPPPPKPKEIPILPPAASVAAGPPAQNKLKMPPFDPCKAIIETSPYYVYFKIITENGTKEHTEEDIREILHKMVVVDEDMPKTAKYRNFRSYVQ